MAGGGRSPGGGYGPGPGAAGRRPRGRRRATPGAVGAGVRGGDDVDRLVANGIRDETSRAIVTNYRGPIAEDCKEILEGIFDGGAAL